MSITPDRRDIYITVNINEGELYTVSDVRLTGQMLLPREELEKLIQLKPGDVFSREKLAASTKAIAERLGNEGYAFANASAIPTLDKEKRSVAFNVVIDPGRRIAEEPDVDEGPQREHRVGVVAARRDRAGARFTGP